jgi:hypothetical protein
MRRPEYYNEKVVRLALIMAREKVKQCLEGRDVSSICSVVRELYDSVPRVSWLARGLARYALRTVHQVSQGVWRVDGIPALGDTYPSYFVTFREGRYECTCFSHTYGYSRRARICTHIAAVMLYRRQRTIGEEG